MIKRVIGWSVDHRVLVLLLTALLVGVGVYSVRVTPVDAIPDLSDVQVIIKTSYPGQAPQVVEDQVTYPLTTAMLSVPFAKVVRGYSFFGFSFVYIIFEDGTDLIDVSDWGVTAFDDLTLLDLANGNALIMNDQTGGTDKLVLQATLIATLSNANFIFR